MNAWLDILGSLVVAGTLIISMLNMNAGLMDRCLRANVSLVQQRDGGSIMHIVGGELRRIGLWCQAGTPAILDAQLDAITFIGDVDAELVSGTPDTVTYRLGDLEEGTPNPEDHALLRIRGAGAPDTAVVATGVTGLLFTYYDAGGLALDPDAVAADPAPVRAIQVEVELGSPTALEIWNPYLQEHTPTYLRRGWVIRVRPKNL